MNILKYYGQCILILMYFRNEILLLFVSTNSWVIKLFKFSSLHTKGPLEISK